MIGIESNYLGLAENTPEYRFFFQAKKLTRVFADSSITPKLEPSMFKVLVIALVLSACRPSDSPDSQGSQKPCEGVNGFHQVHGELVCHWGRVLTPNGPDFVDLGGPFGGDKKTGIVYASGARVEGADLASFEFLNASYARDKDRVYYGRSLIKEADRESFVFVGAAFAKDKSYVYDFGRVESKIDASTFVKVVALKKDDDFTLYEFFKDKDNVYYGSSKISETYNMGISVDASSFAYYGGPFLRANGRVYFAFKEFIDADPDSFQFRGCSLTKVVEPKNHVFSLDSPKYIPYYCYGQDGERIFEREI